MHYHIRQWHKWQGYRSGPVVEEGAQRTVDGVGFGESDLRDISQCKITFLWVAVAHVVGLSEGIGPNDGKNRGCRANSCDRHRRG